MADSIPLIDLADISLNLRDNDIDVKQMKEVGNQIKSAFSTYGFCYFTNHGISQDIVDRCLADGLKFFKKPTEEKLNIKYSTVLPYMGWIGMETEALNRERPCDYKEAFNYHALLDNFDLLPKEFQEINHELLEKCITLAFRVCDALSLAFDIDKTILRAALKSVKQNNNQTCVRSAYYPPVTPNMELKSDQLRCGEHSDYGVLTFLFQDDSGGLEVKSPDDEYIPVPPVRGTIVANIGDLLQRWTADKLLATKHRVIVPKEESQRNKTRQSIAVFIQPDDDCLITCIDGSNKYEPITSAQHLANMMY